MVYKHAEGAITMLQQIARPTTLRDFTALHDYDLVRIHYGVEAVCNRQRSAAAEMLVGAQHPLNEAIGLDIHRGGALVQQQYA